MAEIITASLVFVTAIGLTFLRKHLRDIHRKAIENTKEIQAIKDGTDTTDLGEH